MVNGCVQQTYHRVHVGLSFTLLQSFSGLLSAADLLGCQSQQPTHLLPKEAAVSIVNWPVVGQDLHPWHLIALKDEA